MDENEQKKPRVRLLNKLTLVVLAITSLWALWLVAPTKSMLIQLIAQSSSPEVSLAFLKQLYKRDPQNRAVVKQIINSYTQIGQLEEASQLIRNILTTNTGRYDWEALETYHSILLEQSYQSDPEIKKAAIRQLLALIDNIDAIPKAEIARQYANTAIAFSRLEKGLMYLRPHVHSGETSYQELINIALQSQDYNSAINLQIDAFYEHETVEAANVLFATLTSTFQAARSKDFLEHYTGPLCQEPAFLEAAIAHSQQMGNLDTALKLSQALLAIEPTAERYVNAAKMAISLSDLTLAIELQHAAVLRQPSDENNAVLHNLYRWQGKIEAAQGVSIRLLQHGEPTLPQLYAGVEESRALGDIYYEGLFYNAIAKRGQIKPNEYTAWLNAVEKAEGTDVALASVTALAAKRPNDSALISHKARLYSYLGSHHAVIKEWHKLIRLRQPTYAEALRAANAYILLHQPQQALQALVTPNNWYKADNDYIEAVSSLAWDTNNRSLSTLSQDALVARASNNLDIYRYINLMSPITAERQAKLLALYQRTGNATLLLSVIRARAATEDYDQLTSLLTLADSDPALTNNNEVLTYKAQLALHNHQPDEAKALYHHILQLDPTHATTVSNLLWLAIAENDEAEIRTLYEHYSAPLSGNAELWLAFASAAQILGRNTESAAWYKALLKNDEVNDISVILNYASLLEQQGQAEKAYQLRRYVLKEKRDALLALPDDGASYRSLLSVFTDERYARLMLEDKATHQPNAELTAELFSHYLAANQAERILFWQHHTALQQYALPEWQQLSLALQQKDKAKVEQLLAHALKLPEADKNVALQFVGRHQEAWEQGQAQIGTMADKQAENQLRRAHVLQHPNKTHSVRTQVTQISQWDITRYSIDYYQPHYEGHWRLGTDWQQADTPEQFAGNSINDEFRLRGTYLYQFDDSDLTLDADFANGLGDNRIGALADYTLTINDDWQASVMLGINQHIEASDLLTLAGQDNRVGIRATYQPTIRESLSMQLNYHDLSTRFGDDIGQGWDMNLRLSEQLFFNDPAWQIYGDMTLQHVNLSDEPLNGINAWHQGSRPILSSDFIEDKYQRFAIGQRFWHGEPGQPGATVPSPRYWLDTSIGYNSVTSDIDFTVGAGLGWRLIGNDELYFTTDWQSQDRNGDASLRLQLGYYYTF